MYSNHETKIIFALVGVFIFANLYFRNLIHIVIFLGSYIVLERLLKNKMNAVLGAYIIGIAFGIYKNFHLLENFEKEVPLSDDETYKKLNSKTKLSRKKIPHFSTRQLMKFIDELKKEDETQVFTRKVFIHDLQPTVEEISNNKVKKFRNNKKLLEKAIVISKDNFIVDGHHRWFTLKAISNAQNNKSEESPDNYINATIIDLSVSDIMSKMEVFKNEYNEESMKQFKFDENMINEADNSIKTIQKEIVKLSELFHALKNINLV
jgi:hypothetical protein